MSENAVMFNKNGKIATIVLNRPDAMNAMNKELIDGLAKALAKAKDDREIRTVVLTGQGKAFCAGGDLNYLLSLTDQIAARSFIKEVGNLVTLIMGMDKPVIAMVNGAAAGAGFNLALACDIVFCAKSARFAQSFAKVGLVPDCGGLYLLPRLVGRGLAKELLFIGDMIDAAEAYRIGLVNKVVPAEQILDKSKELATKIMSRAPVAVQLCKAAVNEGLDMDQDSAAAYEAEVFALCFTTDDQSEGMSAFVEKRKANFTGK